MKVKKRVPVRQRVDKEGKRQEKKAQIREAFANGPQKEVQIIPAAKTIEAEAEGKKLRVCAYCRVSTDEEEQASSYELQVQNYTEMIMENEDWEFAGIFADEGISGTSTLHREHFLEMIERCKAGGVKLMLEKFTVMELIQTRSDSVATMYDKTIKFSAQTADELHRPPFVQFLVSEKQKQFAIRACKEGAPNAVRFCKNPGSKHYPIRITLPFVVAQIRRMAGWSEGTEWVIPGVYSAEENALLYDLSTAKPPATRAKRKGAEEGGTEESGTLEDSPEGSKTAE